MPPWFDTIRAVEAHKEFGGDGEGIVWAVLGTGIDASHPHFQQHKNLDLPPPLQHADLTNPNLSAELSAQEALTDLHGQSTIVGALIAGEDPHPKAKTVGVAPRVKLISLKIFAESYKDSERAMMMALQKIKELNVEKLIIHGVCVPLSLNMNPRNYAVGLSPTCMMVNELVRGGVCVVASAGNRGFDDEKWRGVPYTITDPGNAELALTVGSTHRSAPRDYGASYFSSRGPTLDGRAKPDLLAPGERILSAIPDRSLGDEGSSTDARRGAIDEWDGTDAAAAIVSGSCAAVLSAFPSLVGKPLELKRLLMDTAEDLGRERYAQGAGLLDLVAAMRAAAGQAGPSPPAPVTAPSAEAPIELEADVPKPPPAELELHAIPGPAAKRFSVAVSFSGDQREYVTAVVRRLRRKGVKLEHIFFDEYWEAELARPDLDLYLQNIYENEAELLVPFFSRSYVDREWTGVEWRALREVIKTKRADELMPVFLEEVKVPGAFSLDGSLRGGAGIDPEEIGDKILRRLLTSRQQARKGGN